MNARRPAASLPRLTEGWFQIGWTDQVPKGAVQRVDAFGEDRVLYRDDFGELHLVSAYCPHLGAHLGHGGKVVGARIRCPFHGWEFGAQGRCEHIPYSDKRPAKAKLDCMPVIERYGAVFAWRSEDGRAPDRGIEVEDFRPSDWVLCHTQRFRSRAHPIDIAENAVDSRHFEALHGNGPTTPDIRSRKGGLFLTQQTSQKLFGGTLHATLDYHLIEPGFQYLRIDDLPGTRALVLSSVTPVGMPHIDNWITIYFHKGRSRTWAKLLAKFFARQMMMTYAEDMPIWDNKAHLARPLLTEGDGPIGQVRAWYARFAAEGERAVVEG